MALKLSSTVHGTSTGDREKREVPDVGLDHEIYRKSSQFCRHQEVCEEYITPFRYTPPGIIWAYILSEYYMYTYSVQ